MVGLLIEGFNMTKTFCDCCGQEINGPNPKFDTIILSLAMVGGAVIVSPTGKPWQHQDFCEKCVANEVWAELAVRLREMKHKDHPNAIITPPPITDRTTAVELEMMKRQMQSAIDQMIEETYAAQEKLTRAQFKDAIIYAIECGDFLRECVVDPEDGNKFKQTVTYVPFRRVVELENRIKELEQAYRDDV